MLGLLHPTPATWIDVVRGDLNALLVDHAHCEVKAAQSALGMVARFAGECPALVEPLVALAHEETEHFAQVEQRLRERGAPLAMPRSDEYVVSLRRACRIDHHTYPALLDRLLVSALVEARSCERFQLLAEHLHEMELRSFYTDLMASEARHYRLFVRLAEERFGEQETRARLKVLAVREGELAVSLPLGPSMHG